jgi:hypothetical protein
MKMKIVLLMARQGFFFFVNFSHSLINNRLFLILIFTLSAHNQNAHEQKFHSRFNEIFSVFPRGEAFQNGFHQTLNVFIVITIC